MRAKRIGCAAAIFQSENEDLINFYLVCNYSFGNMFYEPIYTVGRTASKCKSGRNRAYKGLCNSRENIAPDSFINS